MIFSTPLIASPFSITEEEINHYLATRLSEKVPLENKLGIPHLLELDYKLSDLNTQIGQTEEKRVAISGTILGQLSAKGRKHQAQIRLNLDTLPYYDPQQGAIYLQDIRLRHWEISPEKYHEELQVFLPLLAEGVANLLNTTPIYTLDESSIKEALIRKFGKAIVVKQGELQLEASIF